MLKIINLSTTKTHTLLMRPQNHIKTVEGGNMRFMKKNIRMITIIESMIPMLNTSTRINNSTGLKMSAMTTTRCKTTMITATRASTKTRGSSQRDHQT